MLARLLEEVAHAGSTDTDDHLDEFGSAHREERHAGLAGHRLGEQRLAGARRTYEQHSLGRRSAESRVLRRIAEEIHDLDELVARLVDTCDIVERDLSVAFLVEAARLALADAHQPAAEPALLRRAPEEPHVERDQQHGRTETKQ